MKIARQLPTGIFLFLLLGFTFMAEYGNAQVVTVLSGTITSQGTGQPIGGAAVTLYNGHLLTVNADASGNYAITGQQWPYPGSTAMWIVAPGYFTPVLSVNITAPFPVIMNRALILGGPIISGTVTDANSSLPVANANIAYSSGAFYPGGSTRVVQTDIAGNYSIDSSQFNESIASTGAQVSLTISSQPGYFQKSTSVSANPPFPLIQNFGLMPTGITETITVGTSPPALNITVDGMPYFAPQQFTWVAGNPHAIATTSPQPGQTETRYTFANWSNGGTISQTIVAPGASTTYTANFTTQYTLTTSANPNANGSITAGGWFDSGTTVAITATAAAGFQFTGFSGDLTGTSNPQNLFMNAPKSVTATFAAVQTIIFGALPNQVFGTGPFTVSATATSGLAVGFASTTTSVCTVSGATVTLVSVGQCSIQASQAGNASYAAATPVTRTFQVLSPAPATMTGPANGSLLPGSSVNFQWTTGTGVSQFWLSISKVGAGGGELYNADPGPGLVTSKTISGLPTDGSTVYVRLYSHLGNNWPWLDYTYTAAGPATMISPANGSMLPGSSVNFQWTTGIGVSQYWLSISKAGAGGGELYNADPGPGLVTSKTISGLPTDGSTIYVRLYSHIGSTWPSVDYTYTAAGPATITSPVNGSTLPGSSVTLQWTTGIGVSQYWLSISKAGAGGGELFNADPGPGLVTSKTISGLPTDGSIIYVRLYSHIGTAWPWVDYTYSAAGPATITSPVNGSTLPGSLVDFQWTTGTNVTQYWLSISRVGVGGGELYNADPGPGLVTSKTISGLPTDGSTIYVRLYSHIGSNWPSRDYVYTAFP